MTKQTKPTMIQAPTEPTASTLKDAGNGQSIPIALAGFDKLPDSALVRCRTVSELFGIHVATVWRHVQAGKFPQPVKVGSAARWRVGDLRAKLAQVGA